MRAARRAARLGSRGVRLWDVKTGAESARLEADLVQALCVLRDGRLASGSRDNTIRLWDVKTGAESARLEGHLGEIRALCVLPGGQLASGSEDKTIRLWDIAARREIVRLEIDSPVECFAALLNGHLVAGDAAGRLHWLEMILT
jgi:WD40 repeat protein